MAAYGNPSQTDVDTHCNVSTPPPHTPSSSYLNEFIPLWLQLCELSLMCQICQIFSTMLKEAFVKVEEPAASSSSLETSARQSGLTVRFSSFVCPSRLVGPLWRLDRQIPPRESSRPPCLVYMSAFPLFSWEGFHCPPPPFPPSSPPFQIRRLECYTDQGKIINCPFVLAAVSTGENKLMVMKPYRVWFRRWVWCDLPSSGVEPSSRASPLWAEACSQLTALQHILMLKCCCCFYFSPKSYRAATCSTCWLIIHAA